MEGFDQKNAFYNSLQKVGTAALIASKSIISRKTKEIKNILTFVVQVAKHSKDFRSRTLIKEALMENDFLKNLSQSQVGMLRRMRLTSNVFVCKK